MNSKLRIGIMGSPGSGKTRLAQILSDALKIPLVDEGVREWLTSRRLREPRSLPWKLQLELQKHYVDTKILRESSHQAFVSDRTTIDAVVILQLRRVPYGMSVQIPLRLVDRALEYAKMTYDRIVLLRWKERPQPNPDGIREIDPPLLQNEYDLCWSLCNSTGMRITVVPALPDKREIDILVNELRA